MALIYEGMTCAICDEVIDDTLLEADDFVATTHFIDDETSPLWQFSDAPMHRECFLAWPLREEFVRAYNERCNEALCSYMNAEGEIFDLRASGEMGPSKK